MNDLVYCQSCGMPMQSPQEFGAGNPENLYCVYCTDERGTLKPYAMVLKNMQDFAVRTMGISEAEAFQMAKEGMSKMPAWKDVP